MYATLVVALVLLVLLLAQLSAERTDLCNALYVRLDALEPATPDVPAVPPLKATARAAYDYGSAEMAVEA